MSEKTLAELLYEVSEGAPARLKAKAEQESKTYVDKVVDQMREMAKRDADLGGKMSQAWFDSPSIEPPKVEQISGFIVSALMAEGFQVSVTHDVLPYSNINKLYVMVNWAKAKPKKYCLFGTYNPSTHDPFGCTCGGGCRVKR